MKQVVMTYRRLLDELVESLEEVRPFRDELAKVEDGQQLDRVADLDGFLAAIEAKVADLRDLTEDLLREDDPGREVAPPYLSLAAAAAYSGLSISTLHNQIHRGRLRAEKLGRAWVTRPVWLFEYLDSRKYNAKAVRSLPGRGPG